MASVTASPARKQARKPYQPPARSAAVQQIGDAVFLWLTVGNNVTAYRVTAIPHAFGKAAFHLQKADKGDGNPEEYDVLLDGPHSTCDCQGFQRHGMNAANGTGCKHIAGCQAALNAGQLHAAPAPKPQPAPKRPWCEHCNDNPAVYCSHCSL
jgi:hypothetical protein